MRKLVALTVLVCLCSLSGFAHAIWIESSPQAQLGQAHTVRVYFGEYTEDVTAADKWFSDLKDFTLVLLTPEGKTLPLKAKPAQDYFEADFVPEMKGVYTVVLEHTAKDVYHGYRLAYNAVALVNVGNTDAPVAVSGKQIKVSPVTGAAVKVQDTVHFSCFRPAGLEGEQEVEVIAPNGWVRKVYADKTGASSFVPLWPGKYMIEMIVKKDVEGTHEGNPYTTDFHCATYMVEVQ